MTDIDFALTVILMDLTAIVFLLGFAALDRLMIWLTEGQ
jgi:hypothetical protein